MQVYSITDTGSCSVYKYPVVLFGAE